MVASQRCCSRRPLELLPVNRYGIMHRSFGSYRPQRPSPPPTAVAAIPGRSAAMVLYRTRSRTFGEGAVQLSIKAAFKVAHH